MSQRTRTVPCASWYSDESPQSTRTENIDASYRYVDDYLSKLYPGPKEIKYLGEQGSGLRTDHVSIVEAEDEIATGSWDLVITEDMSRFYRNPRYLYVFVQDAVDHCTRVICIGDNLDTGDDNWEVTMSAAVLRHGLYIPDTRRRVRRTATNSFHNGGMVQKVRYGYRKLTDAEARSGEFGPKGLRIARLPECTPIIRRMKDMVLAGHKCSAVADWLTDECVKPGPYATSGQWTDRLVEDLLRDPILSGMRTFRDVLCEPVFLTGKHRRRKNPDAPETETYAQLAHVTVEEHQELLAALDRLKQGNPNRDRGKEHPLLHRPRSHSVWPGQHMRCAVCGGLFYWGQGILKCQNAFVQGPRHCWNHLQLPAELVRSKVLVWLLDYLNRHVSFREVLIDTAWQEYAQTMKRSKVKERFQDDQIRDLTKQSDNLAKAIARGGELESLINQLKEVDKALAGARRKKQEEENRQCDSPLLSSREEFAARLYDAILVMARTSYGLADLMRRILPVFVVQPVQALDSGLIRPRAKITLRLSANPNSCRRTDSDCQMPEDVEFVLDLFDPPEHIKHLHACLDEKRKNPNKTLREIGATLGICYMTVKRVFDYHRRMQKEGLHHPYRELNAEPTNASRWKRRKGPSVDD